MPDAGELVVMVRKDLGDRPLIPPPRGVDLRPYREGDAASWVYIQSVADVYDSFDLDRFMVEFGVEHAAITERQVYAVDEKGFAVGTITAWSPENGVASIYGRLHWLAVIPEAERRGIGTALVSAALDRMRALGHERAYLTTSSARTSALRLYERFGFRRVSVDGFYKR